MNRSDFKTVEELPIDIEGSRATKGFHYHQVYRKDGWYIYQVTRTYDNGYTKEFFEVFKEKVDNKLIVINGKFTKSQDDGRIRYPCDEEFGIFAWTLPTFDGCLRKIAEKSQI